MVPRSRLIDFESELAQANEAHHKAEVQARHRRETMRKEELSIAKVLGDGYLESPDKEQFFTNYVQAMRGSLDAAVAREREQRMSDGLAANELQQELRLEVAMLTDTVEQRAAEGQEMLAAGQRRWRAEFQTLLSETRTALHNSSAEHAAAAANQARAFRELEAEAVSAANARFRTEAEAAAGQRDAAQARDAATHDEIRAAVEETRTEAERRFRALQQQWASDVQEARQEKQAASAGAEMASRYAEEEEVAHCRRQIAEYQEHAKMERIRQSEDMARLIQERDSSRDHARDLAKSISSRSPTRPAGITPADRVMRDEMAEMQRQMAELREENVSLREERDRARERDVAAPPESVGSAHSIPASWLEVPRKGSQICGNETDSSSSSPQGISDMRE